MRITLQQTGSNDDLGETRGCICSRKFYLGPVTCWAISEGGNILWGEVCPARVEGGPEHIQRWLDLDARSARLTAEQKMEAAEEGITDCPTLDEVLAAEAFYGRPMFRTGEEFEDALGRDERLTNARSATTGRGSSFAGAPALSMFSTCPVGLCISIGGKLEIREAV